MKAPEMSAKRILWKFIGGVSRVMKSKDSYIRLWLPS
jgi:hypothetical protein